MNRYRFSYVLWIAKLMKQGQVSFFEQDKSKRFQMQVQLFIDGDITVYISNPTQALDADTLVFLEGVIDKVQQKIKSLSSLRRDVERLGALLLAIPSGVTLYHFEIASVQWTTVILSISSIFPELRIWINKIRKAIKSKGEIGHALDHKTASRVFFS